MNRGFIKFWRKTEDSGLLQNPHALQLFCYILLRANHKKTKSLINGTIVEVGEGQLIFGRKKAADDLKTSEQSIRTAINLLKKLKIVTINPTNKFSLITVDNWAIYQNTNQQPNQQSNQQPNQHLTSNQPAPNQRLTTSKECKNERMEEWKNKDIYCTELSLDSSMQEAVPCFIELILNDGSGYGITENEITQWSSLYPAVDIRQDLRKMAGWLLSNPKNRKTRRGIMKFINSWLSKSQDSARPNGNSQYPSQAQKRLNENMAAGQAFLEGNF